MSQAKQKIVFVTGKGGVGKSTVAAALAVKLAGQGKRVLLVELAEQSYYHHLLGLEVSYQPTQWQDNLWVSCWEGDACLREYFKHYVRLETVVEMFFNNVVMKTFIEAAPALREISLLGKATSGIRHVGPSIEFDMIVIDAYATGHFRALLKAPSGLAEAVRMGPMGDQSQEIEGILKDSSLCSYAIVTLPEELPVSECSDLYSSLDSEWGIKPKVFCNKFWKIPLNHEELQKLGDQMAPVDPEGQKLTSYLQVVEERQRQAVEDLKKVTQDFETLPLAFETSGQELIKILAERIEWDGLGS